MKETEKTGREIIKEISRLCTGPSSSTKTLNAWLNWYMYNTIKHTQKKKKWNKNSKILIIPEIGLWV